MCIRVNVVVYIQDVVDICADGCVVVCMYVYCDTRGVVCCVMCVWLYILPACSVSLVVG